jgi:hypothetical protein
MSKIKLMAEFGDFLLERKKWWLVPITLALILLGGLIVLTQGSTALPFLYALF